MSKYVASINVPGYLPEGDAVVCDTASGAWSYLADERRRHEEDAYEPGDPESFSETVHQLDARAAAAAGSDSDQYADGAIYGDTPGYTGSHDLGLAYCVSVVSDAEGAAMEALQG